MAEEKKKREPKPERQQWKPNWLLQLLYRAWMIVFGAAKIAIGAVATVLIICIVCGLVFVGTLGEYLEEDILPEAGVEKETFQLDQTSTLYYVDGNGEIQILQEVYASTSRKWASFDEIPEDLIHAAVAIEDKRFYEHQGVDWITTVKACAKMFFGDSSVGGSTITQQLIKNLTGEDSITVQRKVLEIFRATEFEKNNDKQTIMEWYLNTIYLGNGCGGVKSAAETYFGKELQMLTTAECASLISITNNPSLFDPYGEAFEEGGKTGLDRNRERQEDVLWEMYDQGWITKEEYDEAMAQEMVFKNGIDFEDQWAICDAEGCGYEGTVSTFTTDGSNYYCPSCGAEVSITRDASQDVYSWFVDTVLEDVAWALAKQSGVTEEQWNDEMRSTYMERISRGGYHIYTTIDMDIQNIVDSVYTNLDNVPSTYGGQDLQSAIVIKDNHTGDIVAMSGGFGAKEGFDDFNRATDAQRQTGSSIKPLTVYAPAFESGVANPATVITDLPFDYSSGVYPLNDTRTYSYSRTILSGVTNSVNAVAVYTLDATGLDYSFHFGKDLLGLEGLVEEYDSGYGLMSDIGYGPLALGAQTIGITVRDMTDAFGTFPNNGVYTEGRTFTKVYDSDGNLVLDNTQESHQAFSQKTADYINYCLYNAANYGTGTEAPFSYGIQTAGKTGTTGDNYDRWFCGYTHYYTAAVWCGFDQPEAISMIYNWGNPAAQLWSKVMEPVHEGLEAASVYDTSGMSWASMCLDSGGGATSACKADIRTVKGGASRTSSAQLYLEDYNFYSCSKHVTVEYCMDGDGVATEYCKQYAKEGKTTIQQVSLVKMTQEELNEIITACNVGLDKSMFYRDDYIYLVDASGADASFKGINGDINQNVTAPYKVCTVHTKEEWEKYEEEKKKKEEEEKKQEEANKATQATTATRATTATEPTTAPTTPSSSDTNSGSGSGSIFNPRR